MKAYINEIEITLSEFEQEKIENAAEIANVEIVVSDGHTSPNQIRQWVNTINHALTEMEKWDRNNEQERERINFLEVRRDLRSVLSGIDAAENKFEDAY